MVWMEATEAMGAMDHYWPWIPAAVASEPLTDRCIHPPESMCHKSLINPTFEAPLHITPCLSICISSSSLPGINFSISRLHFAALLGIANILYTHARVNCQFVTVQGVRAQHGRKVPTGIHWRYNTYLDINVNTLKIRITLSHSSEWGSVQLDQAPEINFI